MSRAMTADERIKAYRAEGLTLKEVTLNGKSWRDNNRNFKHAAAQDQHGQIMHHTGPWSTVKGIVRILFEGRLDLPGPLCDDGVAPDGVVWLVGCGWSNHAGEGPQNVYDAVLADAPTPNPDRNEVIDGNGHLYGDEVINMGDGEQVYPNAQITAVIRLHVARARFHGWKEYSSILHRTWTTRKIDAYGRTALDENIDIKFLQREVAKGLALKPGEYVYGETPQPPDPPEDNVDAKSVWSYAIDVTQSRLPGWKQKKYAVGSVLNAILVYANEANRHAAAAEKSIDALTVKVDALVAQLTPKETQ